MPVCTCVEVGMVVNTIHTMMRNDGEYCQLKLEGIQYTWRKEGGRSEVAGRGAVILCFITIDVDIGATCMNSALPRICFI